MTLKVASLSETVTVTGESPLIETSSSSVGGVVDIRRIESLPLNGRQFANLAATIPGVGLGFHSDPTKSTQYAPQINGGAGPQRELPDRRRRQQRRHRRRPAAGLPAGSDPGIQLRDAALQGGIRPEQRRRHEHRHEERHEQSHGKLLRVVPRQVDERARPRRRRSRTWTSRTTAGTSTAAASAVPSRRTRPTSSAPSSGRSRTRRRPSTRRGCSRRWTGPHTVPYRENLVTGKVTASLNASQYVSVRYGYNKNTQPYNRGRRLCDARQLGRQQQQVQLDQPESQLGAAGSAAERVHLPVRGLQQQHRVALVGSERDCSRTACRPAPTSTHRRPLNRRSISSVTTSPGTSPAWAASATTSRRASNYINEPRLFITFNTGKGAIFNTHLTRRRERADPDGDGERWQFLRQRPDQAVRHICSGRLAPGTTSDVEPRPPLRHHGRLRSSISRRTRTSSRSPLRRKPAC